ncbi:MAG: PhnD/SsuA/transferrin family substrate-binding protein, partial [Planctomycetota bacterium]
HQASIRAVAQGTVDAAAVDSLVFDHMVSKTPSLGEALRVIHTSPPFGNPPLVTKPGLPAEKTRLLVKTLLEMDRDAEGRRVLESIGVEKFVIPPPGLYDSARKILKPVLPSLQKGG